MPPIRITDYNARVINAKARLDGLEEYVIDGEVSFTLLDVEMTVPFEGAKTKRDAIKRAAEELHRRADLLLKVADTLKK